MPPVGKPIVVPPPFNVMFKPRGAICNLNCRYCYFLSKEQMYPGSAFRMSDALLEECTGQYIEAQRVPEVTFPWQGGEPTLMGLDFFRRAVELQGKYRKPGTHVYNALQTNATTLDDEWCRFFHEHEFLIGVSLDGPRELHDAYRVDKGGAPTFDRVMRGIALLHKHNVQFNILATVHAANAAYPLPVYRFLRDEVKTQFIQLIPIVERDNGTGFQEGASLTRRSVGAKQYGDFLVTIFDEWVRRDVGRMFVQIFDVALGVWCGQRAGLCLFEETCGEALAMEHNGDLYSCDHFVEPRHRLGNLLETPLVDLITSQQQKSFALAKRDALPRYCRKCSLRFICNGGCPKDRILTTPDGEPGLNYLCEGYRAFFTHIDGPMRMMADLLRQQHPPAEIMSLLASEKSQLERAFVRAGRNAPCPCGSGRKFKQCHGANRSG